MKFLVQGIFLKCLVNQHDMYAAQKQQHCGKCCMHYSRIVHSWHKVNMQHAGSNFNLKHCKLTPKLLTILYWLCWIQCVDADVIHPIIGFPSHGQLRCSQDPWFLRVHLRVGLVLTKSTLVVHKLRDKCFARIYWLFCKLSDNSVPTLTPDLEFLRAIWLGLRYR